MKQLPVSVIALALLLSISTSILYISGLRRTLIALGEHGNKEQHEDKLFLLGKDQVALNFSNNFFHISSDKDWARLHSKPFKLDPQSNREYTTAMHQQLHCLDAIRKAYVSYHLPRPKLSPQLYQEAEMCLEQLRQAVMCNGDLTLEPTVPVRRPDGAIVPGSSGTGVVHRCRNWQKLQ